MLNVLYSFAKNIGNLTDTSTNDKELFIVENLEFYAFIYNKTKKHIFNISYPICGHNSYCILIWRQT